MGTTEENKVIGKITSTLFGYEEGHGILTAELTMDYGGSGQTIGRYNLDSKTGFGIAFVKGILAACGVERWEDVKGRTIFVIQDSPEGAAIGIENLPTEKGRRFIFEELAEEYR